MKDCPNDELAVKVSPCFETLGRRSKKSGGAGFGCNDGSENCPPGNRSPAKREIPQIFISAARPQTERDYTEEIKEQDSGIDCQTRVHVDAIYRCRMPNVECTKMTKSDCLNDEASDLH
jgi:hypothetical protein